MINFAISLQVVFRSYLVKPKADIAKKHSELNQMIPDVHDSVLNMYHYDDKVIVGFESSGTAPDSSKFILPFCTIFEIKNGKITKDLTYYDNFE